MTQSAEHNGGYDKRCEQNLRTLRDCSNGRYIRHVSHWHCPAQVTQCRLQTYCLRSVAVRVGGRQVGTQILCTHITPKPH